MSEGLPALLGGPPVRPEGPPDWPPLDDAIREALTALWADGTWGKYHGGQVEALEACLAEQHGGYAVACGSGTFAVELALRALKIGPGDEVVLSAYDYPGNFLSIHAIGACPVLVDAHPENANLDVGLLEDACGPATRAFLVSHLHGALVPMREVMDIAQRRGIKVIEDAAQNPGAIVQGRRAGTWGDAGVLSFGGSKLLTAGRGGALLTPHADVCQRARTWLHRGNLVCPLSELQAAVLFPQLAHLDERNAYRLSQVVRLQNLLNGVPGLVPFRNPEVEGTPAFYKVGFWFDADLFGLSRDRWVTALRAEGVAFDEGFRALQVGRSPSRYRRACPLTVAERAHREVVILHHPVLLGTVGEIEQVARAVRKVWAYRRELALPQ
jgi:dTDP-4-amino-4,6-dideoxygalactose transaminase